MNAVDPELTVVLADVLLSRVPGEPPVPATLVISALATGDVALVASQDDPGAWQQLLGDNVLTVCLDAEALGQYALLRRLDLPRRTVDLCVEARGLVNGLAPSANSDVVLALVRLGIQRAPLINRVVVDRLLSTNEPFGEHREQVVKHAMERIAIVRELWATIAQHVDMPRAALRGRSQIALAHVGLRGIPVDVGTLEAMEQHKAALLSAAIAGAPLAPDGSAFFVQRGDRVHFRENALHRFGLGDADWPTDADGKPLMDNVTIDRLSAHHPELRGLAEMRTRVDGLNYAAIPIGLDGRHRYLQRPFGSKTGRSQPLGREALLLRPKYTRNVVVAPTGQALICADFRSQEVGIAAALSGDTAMMEMYAAKDPYIRLAQLMGAAPPAATKESHPDVRDIFKIVGLAVQYGGGPSMIATATGLDIQKAKELLALHRRIFPRFWAWRDAAVNEALLTNRLTTVFGWLLHIEPGYNVRSIANFPVQANGAEVLRLTTIRLVEAGWDLIGTVHDSVILEVDERDVDRAVAEVRHHMIEAGKVVLGGFQLRVDDEDVVVIRPGQRWRQKSGVQHWNWLVRQLQLLGVEVANP